MLLPVVLALMILFPAQPVFAETKTVIFKIHYRNAEKVLPFVQNFLTDKGSATADAPTNSLVVTDTPISLENINSFLKRFDKALEQFKIYIRFVKMNASREKSLSAEGSVSENGWKILTGSQDKDGVDVRAQDQSNNGEEASDFFITVASGHSAYIRTGKKIPYQRRWRGLEKKYAPSDARIFHKSIDTGMEVRPIAAGDRVILQITPRIEDATSGDFRSAVRFVAASTRLTVPIGKWVTIGGSDGKSNEVMDALLGKNLKTGESSTVIQLKIERY